MKLPDAASHLGEVPDTPPRGAPAAEPRFPGLPLRASSKEFRVPVASTRCFHRHSKVEIPQMFILLRG